MAFGRLVLNRMCRPDPDVGKYRHGAAKYVVGGSTGQRATPYLAEVWGSPQLTYSGGAAKKERAGNPSARRPIPSRMLVPVPYGGKYEGLVQSRSGPLRIRCWGRT